MLAGEPAVEVLGHRIVWSAALTLGLVLALGRAELLVGVFRDKKRLLGLTASALCITLNWGFFIWGVGHGRALEVSLGYFMYPLCMVLLGALFLGERLNRQQLAAVLLVGAGVAVMTIGQGGVPWLVLVFPLSFGFYGLLRKTVAVDSLVGLTVETMLLFPLALAYLATRPDGGALLAGNGGTTALLVLCGPVTAAPLLLFAYGARRLRLTTLGLMQYFNPTMQMAIAVWVFGEVFTRIHAITFACIWGGLLLYSLPRPRPAG